jgi:3-hydroxy-3-methylglutaryl CoA synthase
MDVGLISYGAYVPTYRLDRKVIAAAWARNPISGERTVANNDEDSITMAVEATRNCLRNATVPGSNIDGLYFASTTAPYAEKMSAVLISTALDMRRDIATADFAQSLRAGSGALRMALDTVRSGSAKKMLVAATDCRLGYPKSDQEQDFGDGSAALLVGSGKENLIATYEGGFSLSNEMMDVWRNPEDRYVKTWENRFIITEGYARLLEQAVSGLMKQCNLKKEDVRKIILPSPDSRSYRQVAQKLGFDLKTQVQDPLMQNVGFCGTAQPLLLLSSALEEANPGDLILVASYGDGADAMLFKATDKVAVRGQVSSIKKMLDDKIMITSYSRFLSYKGILEALPGEPFKLFPSASVTWREQNSIFRLHGSRCKSCGSVIYPVQRICEQCYSKDNYEEVRLAELKGNVFTFTRDSLAGRSDDPIICQTIVELENGMRFYGLMTDCELEKVDVGMPVELVFRRIYEGAGFHNYFWKCRPSKKGE